MTGRDRAPVRLVYGSGTTNAAELTMSGSYSVTAGKAQVTPVAFTARAMEDVMTDLDAAAPQPGGAGRVSGAGRRAAPDAGKTA